MIPATDRFARRLVAVEKGMRALQRQGVGLGSSSFEGTINEYDLDGQLLTRIGQQHDGTHGAITLAGPVPPMPTAATVRAVVGGLYLHWDGEYAELSSPNPDLEPTPVVAPLDYQRTEVYTTLTPVWPGPIFTNYHTSIESARGGYARLDLPVVADGDGYYVWLAVRTTAGKLGPPAGPIGPIQPLDPARGGVVNLLDNTAYNWSMNVAAAWVTFPEHSFAIPYRAVRGRWVDFEWRPGYFGSNANFQARLLVNGERVDLFQLTPPAGTTMVAPASLGAHVYVPAATTADLAVLVQGYTASGASSTVAAFGGSVRFSYRAW